jgi:hypothetical protein
MNTGMEVMNLPSLVDGMIVYPENQRQTKKLLELIENSRNWFNIKPTTKTTNSLLARSRV